MAIVFSREWVTEFAVDEFFPSESGRLTGSGNERRQLFCLNASFRNL